MAQILGIRFAPMQIPLERRLQTATTLVMLTWFMAGWFMSAVFLVYLMRTKFFWIPLLYAGWYVWDFGQHNRGGRRWDGLRKLSIFRYWKDFFPVTLIKTVDLSPNNNYIFCYHPHGIIGIGALCSFMTDSTGFSEKFPGLVPHQLTTRLAYIWPVVREFFMALGASNASKENMQFITRTTGNAMNIVVGGAHESMEAVPGSTRHVLKHRKGFVKMAFKTGAHLVPVYAFGENELYVQLLPNPPGSFIRKAQRWLQKTTGMVPVFFYGRGVLNYSIGWLPRRHPVRVVVGKPILVKINPVPTEEEVNDLHQQYQNGLTQLFEEHKEAYGYGDKELEFI